MNYAGWIKYDFANGSGIGSTLFFSGCKFKCVGCFNKEAQDFNYGDVYNSKIEDLFIKHLMDEKIDHASLMGGEVFHQDLDKILSLVKRIKTETDKVLWVWTGYTIEEILLDDNKKNVLKYIDYLVDGRFDINKRDVRLKFRGSSNQRIIDVQETIKQDEVILYIN